MLRMLRMIVGWPVLWIGYWIVGAAITVLPNDVRRATGMTITIDRN